MVGRASGKERGMKKQKSPGDRIFISMVYVLMGLMGLICLYPMWHVVMASFSDPIELMRHTGVILKPLGFSLEGYRVVIENPNILPSYFNTIVYVLVGTAINMFLTILGAYALSRKGFMLKLPTSENAPGMLRANITTQVFEPGGDASIQTLSVPYSPFPSYVGINLNQPQGRYIETDKEHIFDIVTVSPDGKPVNRSGLEYKIYRISWSWWWENDNE